MKATKQDKQLYCTGCHCDFYNNNNPMGIKECWHFKVAKLVKRYCIAWWTPWDNKDNFSLITTLDCHTEPGKFAYLPELPKHLR